MSPRPTINLSSCIAPEREMQLADIRAAIVLAGFLALTWRFRIHGEIEVSWGYIILSVIVGQIVAAMVFSDRPRLPAFSATNAERVGSDGGQRVWPASAATHVRRIATSTEQSSGRVEVSLFAPDEQGRSRDATSSRVAFALVAVGIMVLFWQAPALGSASIAVSWLALTILTIWAAGRRKRAQRLSFQVEVSEEAVTVQSSEGNSRLRFGKELRVVHVPLLGGWELYRTDSPQVIRIDLVRKDANEILGELFRRGEFNA